jgi:8-oxo-dGTP pyrophosphatase MutT (NUDIX family)
MAKDRHQDRMARWAKSGKPGSPPVQAATVIPIRDGAEGIEVLMLRRNSKIAFGGMWVFPGGRVDPGDQSPSGVSDERKTALRAAVREAREETGLELPADSLVAYSHWTPPPITPKRFLTWFFLAQAPDTEIVIDGGEIHEYAWMRPADALSRRDGGEIELAPPTWVTLHELSGRGSVAEALAKAEGEEPERFETHIAMESDGPTAMWQGDAGWADGNADEPGPRHRLQMHGESWIYKRTLEVS